MSRAVRESIRQILNPADADTRDSTNLSIVAYDLRRPENMLTFTRGVLDHLKQKHTATELGEWAINTFTDKQADTVYEIRDCYRTAKPFGIYVRLAVPKLSRTTEEWSGRLENDFMRLLQSIQFKEGK